MIRIATAAIVVAAVLAPCAASAQAREIPSTTVKYADLDIAKAAGARILYARIRSAALDVCHARDEPEADQLARYVAERKCVAATVIDGVRRVNASELTRVAGLTPLLQLAAR